MGCHAVPSRGIPPPHLSHVAHNAPPRNPWPLITFITTRCLSNLFIGRNGARLRFFEENDACGVFKKILKAFSLSSNLVQYQIPDAYSNISFLYALKFIRNLKNISFVVMFSAACERFYCRVDDVKNDCAVALNEHPQQGAFRKTFKNLLRLCNVRSSKMRLCGLFAVDAALPLRLLGLMATYCIVLLQFAFL
ncbi:hypothetical protein EVAR_44992_1 [Eumeta japonica]|uniref:Gustatory receptor n=1 Tax=Eumeta variegata TaxID=151549 RepID=A0A4C1XDJ7_EUMVA|nr:hypothetical protein EVAR_44992_1 [Eumeta japonica]